MELNPTPVLPMVPVSRMVPEVIFDLVSKSKAGVQIQLWVHDSLTAAIEGVAVMEEWDGYGYRYLHIDRSVIAQSMKDFPVISYDDKLKHTIRVDMHTVTHYTLELAGKFTSVRFYVSDTVHYEVIFIKKNR